MTTRLDPDGLLGGVLISADDLARRVRELGAEITRDYAGRDPLLVCVLKGAFVFLGDLVRAIEMPCALDFMAISSYGSGTQRSGVVRIVKDLEVSIEGRDVIVVEADGEPVCLPGIAIAPTVRRAHGIVVTTVREA